MGLAVSTTTTPKQLTKICQAYSDGILYTQNKFIIQKTALTWFT